MKNKFVFTIVAIVFAIAIIVVGIFLIFKNSGDTTISIGNAKALSGDTVEIPLTIEKNHGIWGGQILIDYDSSNLSFLSIENGEVFDECQVNDAGDCVAVLVTQSVLEDSRKDGLIATLKFKIKVSAKDGEHSLKFNDETNFCNADEEMIEPELKGGKITVK